jgi:PhnB protein
MYDPGRGYPSVVPYVRYRDPEAAIAWLTAVLGAREAIRMTVPDGRVGHAELVHGGHVITLGLAAVEDEPARPPADRNAVRTMTLVFVSDVDAAAVRAVELGGAIVDVATDMPWGVRQAVVADPEGHVWELSTHTHDVPLEAWGATRTGPWLTD